MAWQHLLHDGRLLESKVPINSRSRFFVPEAAANHWSVEPQLQAFVQNYLPLQGRNVGSHCQYLSECRTLLLGGVMRESC